jgi:fimbrial chaperone protein
MAFLAFLWGMPAFSAAVDVNPVRVDLHRSGVAEELRLRNRGEGPISMEIATMEWSQADNGEDQLVETPEILAVPPIFTIPAGGEQIVRVALLGVADPDKEGTYRLLINELAPAESSVMAGISMRLQLSLPVFVTPPGLVLVPDLELLSARGTERGTRVTLRNAGSVHLKLKSVEVTGSAGTFPEPEARPVGAARYILPGASIELLVPGDAGTLRSVNVTPDGGRGWEYAVANPE